MEVIVAENAGFCFGVKRAVEMVYAEVNGSGENGPIYTYGPIIHNELVVGDLESRGVRVVNSIDELAALPTGTVIVRSHGVTKREYEQLVATGNRVVDATCPFVKRIHREVAKSSERGEYVLIIGDRTHPEVVGIIGWLIGDYSVVDSEADIDGLQIDRTRKLTVVSQTTYNHKKFKELVEIIQKKGYYVSVVDTICSATEERQTTARQIASTADAMIVIGGAHSSNTRKLYDICKRECESTFLIQTPDDLDIPLPDSVRTIGITAGASTPNTIIEEVQNYVRTYF